MSAEDSIRSAFDSQYQAGLDMLEAAVRACPDDSWDSSAHVNRFWHIAYHTLFYVDLYLCQTVYEHVPWRDHREDAQNLRPGVAPYSRGSILEFLAYCREHARRQIAALDLSSDSGFSWLPFGPVERLAYNLRHLQHHTGQLSERIRQDTGDGVGWVGRG
ncbi:MAG: DinB family protein [Spirochaetaceae bacterium]|nr:DinB family protein [Spirochaetaceae bacterium]